MLGNGALLEPATAQSSRRLPERGPMISGDWPPRSPPNQDCGKG
ncbi:nuclear receptor-interacting protein 2 isoform X1 [Prionailurus iriomotensis]